MGGMTPPRRPRDARGPVVAGLATGAALLSHLAAGGAAPGPLGVLVPWALATALSTALAGRRLALWRTVLSVAASQVLFHTLFVLGAPAAGGAAGTRHTGHGWGHGGYTLPPRGTAALPDLVVADPTMWLWHGGAALATVAVLYGGERLLARLRALGLRAAAWFRPGLPTPVRLPVAVARPAAPDWFTGTVPARPEVSPSRRRGPPPALAY